MRGRFTGTPPARGARGAMPQLAPAAPGSRSSPLVAVTRARTGGPTSSVFPVAPPPALGPLGPLPRCRRCRPFTSPSFARFPVSLTARFGGCRGERCSLPRLGVIRAVVPDERSVPASLAPWSWRRRRCALLTGGRLRGGVHGNFRPRSAKVHRVPDFFRFRSVLTAPGAGPRRRPCELPEPAPGRARPGVWHLARRLGRPADPGCRFGPAGGRAARRGREEGACRPQRPPCEQIRNEFGTDICVFPFRVNVRCRWRGGLRLRHGCARPRAWS